MIPPDDVEVPPKLEDELELEELELEELEPPPLDEELPLVVEPPVEVELIPPLEVDVPPKLDDEMIPDEVEIPLEEYPPEVDIPEEPELLKSII